MCYKHCRNGFHGIATICWADVFGVGVGTAVGLEPCPENTDGKGDWKNLGLTCTRWKNQCHYWGTDIIGHWWTGCLETVGRLDHGGVCPGPQDFGGSQDEWPKWKRAHDKPDPKVGPDGNMETAAEANALGHKTCDDMAEVAAREHTEYVDGMCYRKCPADYPHRVPGQPYNCYKGGELSYDRGGGRIPPAFRVLGKYAMNIPPHAAVDNTPT